jgi:cytochrome c oxidase cbb3-type subunit III
LDGRGGDKGPNISGSANVRRLSDARVLAIISEGISGTGMPAFHSLGQQQNRAIVSYLRVLQGNVEARKPPGDGRRGREIFFGKGECSSCHAIAGQGGFLGRDLTSYGSALSAKAIRDEIVKPDRIEPAGYRSAALTTHDGNRLEGVVRNEDNFSVQFQTKNGDLHFFQKSDLRTVEHLGQSLMPANYGEKLSTAELNDLVSYLMNTGPAATTEQTLPKSEDSTE